MNNVQGYKWNSRVELEKMTKFAPDYADDEKLRQAMQAIISFKEQAEQNARAIQAEEDGNNVDEAIKGEMSLDSDNGEAIQNALDNISIAIKDERVDVNEQYSLFLEKLITREEYRSKYAIDKKHGPPFAWLQNLGHSLAPFFKKADMTLVKFLRIFSVDISKIKTKPRQRIRAAIANYYCASVSLTLLFFTIVSLLAVKNDQTDSFLGFDPEIILRNSISFGGLALLAFFIDQRQRYNSISLDSQSRPNNHERVYQGLSGTQKITLILGGILVFIVTPYFSNLPYFPFSAFVVNLLLLPLPLLISVHPTNYIVEHPYFHLIIIMGSFLSFLYFWSQNLILYAVLNVIINVGNIIVTTLERKEIIKKYGSLGMGSWVIISSATTICLIVSISRGINISIDIILVVIAMIVFITMAFLSHGRLATVHYMRVFGFYYFFYPLLSAIIYGFLLVVEQIIITIFNKTLLVLTPNMELFFNKALLILAPNMELFLFFLMPFLITLSLGVLLFRKELIGSRNHLRFGWIMVEAMHNHVKNNEEIKLEPVFGAMFSRFGGAVGVGETGLLSTQTLLYISNGVLGYHGIAHDAGGFLQNNFGIGPGYQYACGEEAFVIRRSDENKTEEFPNPGASLPLTGQVSGISYWADSLKDRPQDFDPDIDMANTEEPFLKECEEKNRENKI